MVSVDEITRSYGATEALKGVSFEVTRGELFGIIGPDGAGKSSLFRILTTLMLPDKGRATVDGLDVVADFRKIRSRVGYMPGRFSLYPDLTVEENLTLFATVFHTTVKKNYHLIKDIYQQIEPFKKRRAAQLSGGMKQKLALSCALIHKPVVLFLDEPTTGVDPVSRKELWEMLISLKRQGITILVSTPYMDEAKLCDRVALMQEGRFLLVDTPQAVVSQYDEVLWAVCSDRMWHLLADLRANPMVKHCFAFGDLHHVTLRGEAIGTGGEALAMEQLKATLEARGHQQVTIHAIAPGIEDCFMQRSLHHSLTENESVCPG